MKKLLLILLILISLTGCKEEEKKEIELVGAYEKAEDSKITDELQELFDKALESYEGEEEFELVKLLETQVVAGTNYKFLAKVEGAEKVVIVYEDLQGNAEITSVEDYK